MWQKVLDELNSRRAFHHAMEEMISLAIALLKDIAAKDSDSPAPAAGDGDPPATFVTIRKGAKATKAGRHRRGTDPNRKKKPCRVCSKIKALAEFPKNVTCPDGHVGTCKKCTQKRVKAHAASKKAGEAGGPGRPIACQICGKPFANAYMLEEHRALRHRQEEAV